MQIPPIPQPPPHPAFAVLEDILLPVFGMVLAAFAIWQLFRTVNRWLDRRAGAAPDEMRALRADVERLHSQGEGVEELRHRVGELEERLDFAERLLARERDRRPLAPGREG